MLTDENNRKYSNTIIRKVYLCIICYMEGKKVIDTRYLVFN